MTHKECIVSVQKACHLDSQQCSLLLNALCRLMAQAGVEQVPVTLAGLGTFVSHKHPEYVQEDPQTGRQTLYPPRITYRMQSEHDGEDEENNPLARQLAENTKTEVEECRSFLTALANSIQSGLTNDQEVEVRGLGSFRIVSTHTGDLQRVAFSPDETMREQVNAPFNCFEPMEIPQPKDTEVPDAESAASEVAALAASINEEPTEEVSEPEANIPSASEPNTPIEPDTNIPAETEAGTPAEPEEKIPSENEAEIPSETVAEIPSETVAEIPVEPNVTEQSASEAKKEPVQPMEVVNIGEVARKTAEEEKKYYKEHDDGHTPLFYTCIALCLILVVAVIWFVSNICHENVPAEIAEGPQAPVAEAAVDTSKDMIMVAEPDSLAEDTLAKNDSVITSPSSPETVKEEEKPATSPVKETSKPAANKIDKSSTAASDGTVWKIQFLTAGKVYDSGDKHLGGLTPVSYYKEGAYFKYTYGSAARKEDLSKDMEKVRAIFKDAFYVQFDKDGKRIHFTK